MFTEPTHEPHDGTRLSAKGEGREKKKGYFTLVTPLQV